MFWTHGVVRRCIVVALCVAGCCAPRSWVLPAGASSWHESLASTYGIGDGFLGGPLACGGRLDESSPVVAHKSLPCGTRVEFRFGGNAVVGVVRDRGPYVAGRDFDFGPRLERALGFDCICVVRWRILPARVVPRVIRGRVVGATRRAVVVLSHGRRFRLRVWRRPEAWLYDCFGAAARAELARQSVGKRVVARERGRAWGIRDRSGLLAMRLLRDCLAGGSA